MEDIPLHEDHSTTTSTPFHDQGSPYPDAQTTFVAPEVVIHDSPAKPSTREANDAVKVGYRHPILHKQSSCIDSSGSSSATDEVPTLLVLLTIVSASGLLKVHKFGVQAPYLEMKISSDEASPFRTAECKKGGTEAVWNQSFTRRLHSLDDSLYVAAKASTTVIGDLVVSFRSLGLSTELTNHTLELTRGKAAERVGTICLQCRVLDPTAPGVTPVIAAAPIAPLPPQQPVLPMPSCVDKPVEPKVSVAKVKYNDVGASVDNGVWDAAIRKGALMFKIPYHQSSGATPKRKWVALQDLPKKGLCITWSDPHNPVESSHHLIALHDVVEVKTGIKTMAFRKQHAAHSKGNTFFHEDVCFSLISASRSLDLAAASKEEAALWVASVRRMLQHQTTTSSTASSSVVVGLRTSAKIMQDFKTAATTPIRDKSTHAMWMQDLFRYAKAQQLSEIAHFLMDGCPVDLLEPQTGDTILFLACRSGYVALLELCLKWGAKNDPHPTFGDTALQIAVKASQPECVRQLLSIAAKSDMDTEIVNHVDHANQAPLHVAASQGDVVCLQLLLHHGADICVVQANGHTPLHCAVLGGHESCVAYILDVGGDAIINTGDGLGNTPLHCAVQLGHERLVKLLLESAADVTVVNNDNLTPYKLARRLPKLRAIQALLAIYEPEPPPTPSKEQPRNLWQSTPQSQSARLQVRDALMKHKSQNFLMPSPAKSLSARSASEGEFDGYTSSSSTTSNCVGDGTVNSTSSGSFYCHEVHPTSPYYPADTSSSAHHPTQPVPPRLPPHSHVVPPSHQYPTYATYDWQHEWEVKYTDDGHAYYVNLYTGMSQWEAPPALHGYDPYATYDEKESLLARQADKGEFGKAEKFMMMLEDKKQKVMWEDDKYKQLLDTAIAAGDVATDQMGKLRQVESVPDLSCLLRSELQDVLDSLINGCRTCQNLLSQAKARLKQTELSATSPSNSTTLMGASAVAEFERFIKASVGEINDATDEFRQAKAWENKLVSEFGAVLEDFSPHEILCAVKELIA
ncbi:hypothetical protein DYB32_006388 [Aphanomyces invadans]|uniref:WW domain-containing protein n=1 Tax=Aphanomyces invadans TaxID=157072 RepID=A0A3R6Y752_9STRA|nr:hypothetical protein DYB32_006388 [Aphanomyces invadans]